MRVRSYKRADKDSQVFIEIKKKYRGIVYKRRMGLSEQTTKSYLKGELSLLDDTQISKEIEHLLHHYKGIQPSLFLSYDREAYFSNTDPNFRMTFDRNVIIRDYDMNLTSSVYGEEDMLNGKVILEVKTVLGIPKWLLDFFSENKIYKTSFSKYGNAYTKFLLPKSLKEKSGKNKVKVSFMRKKKSRNKYGQNKISIKFIPYIAALLLYLIVFTNFQYQNALPYSEFYIDVNPSIQFTTNRRGKVIDLNSNGLQGEKIVENLEYVGETIDGLIEEILDKMILDGYISHNNQHLLLSVNNENHIQAQQDRLYLDNLIYSYLNSKDLNPIVLNQTINNPKNLENLLNNYDISPSKMNFINNISLLDGNLNIDELAELSISELVHMSNGRSLDITKIINTRDMDYETVIGLSLIDLEQTKIVYIEKPINNYKYYDKDWDEDEDEDEED